MESKLVFSWLECAPDSAHPDLSTEAAWGAGIFDHHRAAPEGAALAEIRASLEAEVATTPAGHSRAVKKAE